jgi:4-amino-4-deoxy-L-arabinose transferase-like glycosyltransferase
MSYRKVLLSPGQRAARCNAVVDVSRSRAKWGLLLTIFVVALVLRLVFIMSLEDRLYWSDEHQYMKGVSQVLDKGEWYLAGSYKPPGYVYFLVALRAVFGESLAAVRVAQSVLGALVCLLTFALASKLFSRHVAIAAAAYVAAYPLLIYVSGVVMPQALETALITGVLLLLIIYREGMRRRYLVLSGLLLGLGALTVPLILALIPLAGVWILALRRWSIPAAVRDCLVLGLCALSMILPWTLRNYLVEQRFIFIATLGSQLLYLHCNPWADPDDKEGTRAMAFKIKEDVMAEARANPAGPTEDEIYLQRYKEFVSSNPGRAAVIYLKKFKNFFGLFPATFSNNEHTVNRNIIAAATSYAPVLVFSIVGAVVSFFRRREGLLLIAVPVLFALGYSLFHTTVRYRIPTEPCSIVLASYGLLWLASRVGLYKGPLKGEV